MTAAAVICSKDLLSGSDVSCCLLRRFRGASGSEPLRASRQFFRRESFRNTLGQSAKGLSGAIHR
jgi:hypothetical protein